MDQVDEYVKHINKFFDKSNIGIKYHIFSEKDTGILVHGSNIRQLVKQQVSISELNTTDKCIGKFEYTKNYYDKIKNFVSKKVLDYLKFLKFQDIVWSAFEYSYAESTGCKYNSCFVTVDNILFDKVANKVLLIKRKDNGKYAIPGGFAEPYMNTKENALRELQEETNISKEDLAKAHINFDVSGVIIDAPYRDPRSSIKCNFISIIYLWTQPYLDLCDFKSLIEKAKAGDDAVEIVWLNIKEIEDMPAYLFHADHKKILCKLLGCNYFLV